MVMLLVVICGFLNLLVCVFFVSGCFSFGGVIRKMFSRLVILVEY